MANHSCAVCQSPATHRCAKCKLNWYCGVQHQRQDWPQHKRTCNDAFQADQHTLHKQAFDRIIQKYKLQQKAGEIADKIITQGISAPDLAKEYEMDVEEAVVFLEWIQVGVKFKEETLDVAKKSGLLDQKR